MLDCISMKLLKVFLSFRTTLHYEVYDNAILGQWFPTWGLSPPLGGARGSGVTRALLVVRLSNL